MAEIELPALYVDNVAAIVAVKRPVLINRDPQPFEKNVPIDSLIAVEIVDPGNDGIDRLATRIWINEVLAFDGRQTSALQTGFAGPLSAVVASADTLRIVFDQSAPFASEAVVEVRAVTATNGGEHSLEETYHFYVEDKTAPKLVTAQAIAQSAVKIGFDEDIIVIDQSGFSFEPLDFPAVPIMAVAASANGNIVTVILDTAMTPDGRYRLRVTGVTDGFGNPILAPFDQAIFIGFRPARPRNRRFDLWSMLPKYNRRTDVTGDLRHFISCLQELIDLLLADIDRFPDIFDLHRACIPFLDLILVDLGNPFVFELDELSKRRLAAMLLQMYKQKGTAQGIRNAIRFFLGIEISAIRAYSADTMVLGESELGCDWAIGPADRFARYAFNVEVDITLTPRQRELIRAIVIYLRPCHTHFIDLIEPASPPTFDHWELGISTLDDAAILH